MTQVQVAPLFFSQRLLVLSLASLGTLMVFVTRVNLSVAIICMLRVTPGTVNSTSPGKNVTTQCHGDIGSGTSQLTNDTAEFDWEKSVTSQLLSMYFYGYICTQILSGWLASRYGGARVWGVSMFVCGLSTLLTPVGARTNVYLVFVIRIIVGVSSGVTFPCIQAMLRHWAPEFERSKLSALIYAGAIVGNIITFSISGLMCKYGFDNGWGSIFYLSGLFTVLWSLTWSALTSERPGQHRWITEREKLYIESCTAAADTTQKVGRIPWLQMFTSGPLLAATTAHFCSNYNYYTLLTLMPTFFKESLNFDMNQNGLLSSLPYICELVVSFCAGYVADTIREKGMMSTKSVRKTFQCSAFVGMAVCMFCVGQVDCTQRYLAVIMLCICIGFNSFNRAGFLVNHLDLAPSLAGILFGITNTPATVTGMIAPVIAGALTPNKTTEEWRNVFYVCGSWAVLGAIVYLLLADGQVQKWALPQVKDAKLDAVVKKDQNVNYMNDPGQEDTVSNKQITQL